MRDGWILKEGVFLRGSAELSASLSRVLWLLSWRNKKVTYLHHSQNECMFFAQNGRNEFVPNADFLGGGSQIVDGTGKKHYTAFVRKRFHFGKL